MTEHIHISRQPCSLKIDVTTPPIADAINVIKTIKNKDKYLLLNINMRYNLS